MNEFKKYNLNLISDFKIKIFKEREEDLDLIIPLENRTVNLCVDGMPGIVTSRIQYNNISSMMIRLRKDENNIGTLHFLGNEGIHSTISNFEVDYGKCHIKVLFKESYVEVLLVSSNCPSEYEKI